MKKITTSKGTFIFVEVPNHAIPDLMCVDQNGLFRADYCTLVWSGNPPEPDHDDWTTLLELQLPKESNYELICTTSKATEEHAAMVVEEMGYINGNVGYKSYHKEIEAICPSSLFSLLSLIDGSGLSIDNNYAILKQI